MEKQYILGIDGGTQSTKVLIFDTTGHVVCEATQPLRPLLLAEPDIVLHPDDDLWDSLIRACRMALSKFPGNPADILGVGLCTIRCCRALLKADGTLAYPVMSWMDRRLSEPYVHDNPAVRYVTTTSGYITHRLTGCFCDTAANYEGMWPLDYRTWNWSEDPAAYERCRIPREMLFDLIRPGEILGEVTPEAAALTGIPAGIPVIATANDKAVEMLGAGRPGQDAVLVSLGTYITSMVQGNYMEASPEHYWLNLASEPGRYLYESYGIRRGMWAVSWIRNLLGSDPVRQAEALGISTEDYLNRLAENIPAGCEGLLTIPDFLAPVSQPYKRGVMLGFDGRHTGIHMYRSIQEAIVMTMHNHATAMTEELGMPLRRVVVSGGGAKGNLFMQLFADVFGLPTERNEAASVVGLGAAICACVGLGVYPDFDTAITAMVRRQDTFQPNLENHTLYTRINEEVYRHITDSTDEILKKMHPIFHP